MIQNKINKVFTAKELAEQDAAIAVLQEYYQDYPVLSASEKARLVKLPDGGEEFVKHMTEKAEMYSDYLPKKYDNTPLINDNTLAEQVGTRLAKLETLRQKMEGVQFLADSDRFSTSLYLRRTLKENGKGEGLDDGLDEGLKRFLSREGDSAPAAPVPPSTTPPAK